MFTLLEHSSSPTEPCGWNFFWAAGSLKETQSRRISHYKPEYFSSGIVSGRHHSIVAQAFGDPQVEKEKETDYIIVLAPVGVELILVI